MSKSILELIVDMFGDNLSKFMLEDNKVDNKNVFSGYVKNDNGDIEYKKFDVTTYEGFSEYMRYLGDLQVEFENSKFAQNAVMDWLGVSNDAIKEMFDNMANAACNIYYGSAGKNAPKDEQTKMPEKTATKNVEKTNDDKAGEPNKQCNFDEGVKSVNNCECKCNKQLPSDLVDDEHYNHICNIIEEYYDEFDIDEGIYDTLYNELIEFACWLYKKK